MRLSVWEFLSIALMNETHRIVGLAVVVPYFSWSGLSFSAQNRSPTTLATSAYSRTSRFTAESAPTFT